MGTRIRENSQPWVQSTLELLDNAMLRVKAFPGQKNDLFYPPAVPEGPTQGQRVCGLGEQGSPES